MRIQVLIQSSVEINGNRFTNVSFSIEHAQLDYFLC